MFGLILADFLRTLTKKQYILVKVFFVYEDCNSFEAKIDTGSAIKQILWLRNGVMPELSTLRHKGLDIIVIMIHDLVGDDLPTTFLHVTYFGIIILYLLHSR